VRRRACRRAEALAIGPAKPDDPADWIGDKGYIGNGMLTPIRKPQFRGLLDWEKKFNKQVGKIRYRIEQAIANLKTWRILHIDYRRPLASFAETISAVIAWSSTGSTLNNPQRLESCCPRQRT